jgi:uncharacterized protein (TIGR03067 family)
MKYSLLTLAAAGLLLAGADAPSDDVKKEMEKFQGTWSLTAITRDGEEVPAEELAELRLVIKGDKRVVKAGDEVKSQSTYKLDPTKKPKAIDVTMSEGPLAGRTLPGIYEIEGDTQKLCLTLEEGAERPKEFTSKPGSGHLLQVFKREKKGT